MPTLVSSMEQTGEFVHLDGDTSYQGYFDLLTRASETLVRWYQRGVEGAGVEEAIVASFLGKLIYTVKLLALKHANSTEPKLRLDLNESGYPHLMGIMNLETDVRRREETLRMLDRPQVIKHTMLDRMFERKEEPTEQLATMALRQYFELLDEEKVLLAFTPGELVLQSEDHQARHYMFSWACYDVTTNVPHVHILLFEQDKNEEPLHNKSSNYAKFMSVVRAEGGRVPPLNVVAIGIDTAIESIHPKILKRIKLGPLYHTGYSVGDHPLLDLLRKYGKEGDYALHIRNEMVFSARQVKSKGFLTSARVREIFAVPQEDIECAKAGVSSINRMLVLPHHIAQQLDQNEPALEQYQRRVTFTKEGEVHGI